jgi:DNA modification methylase
MTYQLIHGDCLQVLPTIEAGSIDAVITDPPYGIDYQSARRTDRTQWKPKIANDKEPFLGWLEDAFRVIKTGGALVCFCRWDVEQLFKDEIERAGFVVKSQIIWDKVIHGMGDLDGSFAPQHENMWFATKGDFSFPGLRPKSIIRVARVYPDIMIHPNEKPAALFSSLARSIVPRYGVVLDCFLGSGASGEGTIQAGRDFIGIEMLPVEPTDPDYFGMAEKRIAAASPPLFLDAAPAATQPELVT